MADLFLIPMPAILSTVFEPVLTRHTAPGGEPTPDPFSRGGER